MLIRRKAGAAESVPHREGVRAGGSPGREGTAGREGRAPGRHGAPGCVCPPRQQSTGRHGTKPVELQGKMHESTITVELQSPSIGKGQMQQPEAQRKVPEANSTARPSPRAAPGQSVLGRGLSLTRGRAEAVCSQTQRKCTRDP